ncbi:MAG: hypothetical protein N2316_06740 [Spirochaetes bacterium]|nr:hypothetical protein [Spirochaetota bacterium]
MKTCKDCINREICGRNNAVNCEHYDIPLTRSEILMMLGNIKNENPAVIPSVLDAVKRTYRINLAY